MNLEEIKEYIQNNPEEYQPEKHKHLFTSDELKDLSQSLRGAI